MVADGIAEEEFPEVERNPWIDNLFRPLVITVMIMCFNISLVNLTRLINPAWRGTYFLIGMFLVTVEAIYSYRILKNYRLRDVSAWRYRAGEWAVLVLLLKIFHLADKPMAVVMADLRAMWQNPVEVASYEFYVMLFLAAISWLAATLTIVDFEELYDPFSFRSNQLAPLERLRTRFFLGGVILMVISGITQLFIRFGPSRLTDWQRPSVSGVIVNVLIYFLLGLVLLSQANLARLLMRWRYQKIEIGPGLTRQWAKYGLVFLGLITFVAFFLPTSYTTGFLTSAAIVIRNVINILYFFIQLVFLLFTLPLAWLLSLFGKNLAEDTPPPPPEPLPMAEASPQASPIPWLEALRSLIFWLLTLAIIGYLLKIYLNDRPELFESLKKFKPIGLITGFLKGLWQQLRRWAKAGLEIVSETIRLPGSGVNTPVLTGNWRWFSLGSLSARERILYYYLNILKRAERRRLARKGYETPFEYEPNLENAVPEVEPEVHDMTGIFVRARYSQEGFDEEQANLVKQEWERIRKELRHVGRSSSKTEKSEDDE
ncbi:MAG: DUF4129 domain-containing protein [Anaerolineae bacterium]|nr:DUF4129 domain-containing protein [Anaerolineae bacterium]